MASEASNIVRLQPRHNRAGNIANLHGGRVIPFPEQGMATTTIFDSPKGYMDAWTLLNCQAALVVASAVALYFKACDVSLGLHPQQDGASACKKIYPSQGKRSPNAEDQA
jgi:hypothetical protein